MKRALKLTRPLAVIDLETTGTAPEVDRIVEIAILKVYPNGKKTRYCKRVNPGISIPPEASKVHGIRDKDVKRSPIFRKVARAVARLLKNCDIAGFKITTFDLPLLQREFERADVAFSVQERSVIDVMRIFHTKEPRDLPAAVRFYLETDHDDAHSALADARMTFRVLEAQLLRYRELPCDPLGLHQFCNAVNQRYLDSGKKFEWRHCQPAFTFGKHKGRLLKVVAKKDQSFLEWMIRRDFPADTKKIAEDALKGKFPKPKAKVSK